VPTVLLAAGLLAAGCDGRSAANSEADVAWTLRPAPPIVGPASLAVTLRSRNGELVTGAQVHLEAHMSHEIPFSFTMAGDWAVIVAATMPHGERIERRVDVANVRPPE
jgi:hypothetical protein